MASLTVATWNVNSVRKRADAVTRYLREAAPDVLCLQEIKCRDGEFPSALFTEAGYPHLVIRGQKGWHGVAIASRLPIEAVDEPAFCHRGEARVAAARVAGVDILNLYAPSGGDEPDPAINDKFAHKLDFWARLKSWGQARRDDLDARPVVVLGDLNIAPGPFDVTDHKRNLTNVGHTPTETEAMTSARAAGGFVDLARAAAPEPALINSWWSYRVREWSPEARGWRLDYIWASAAAVRHVRAVRTDVHTRGWPDPSDHAPVVASLET